MTVVMLYLYSESLDLMVFQGLHQGSDLMTVTTTAERNILAAYTTSSSGTSLYVGMKLPDGVGGCSGYSACVVSLVFRPPGMKTKNLQ